MLRLGSIKKIFEPIDNAVNKSRFGKEFSKAVREGKIFYIYDVEMLSNIIGCNLQSLCQACIDSGERICYDEFFRIDRKAVLRLFARVFPYNSIGYIIELKYFIIRKPKHG